MVVAIAIFDFHLPACRGLKEKRSFLRPLKSRLRSDFEISAAEVGHQDLHQRSLVAIAAVGSDRSALEPLLEKIVRWIEAYAEESGAELADARREFLTYGDVGTPGNGFGREEERA